jgi:hypothetical protein
MYRYLILTALALLVVLGTTQAASGTVYFIVAETVPFHNDSYVLPLTEPSDIAHARDLIFYGPSAGQPIVVANIGWDLKGININRDFDPTLDARWRKRTVAPSWSWYVTEFIGFTNSTPETYDGTPTQIEDGTFTGGTIGFWSYTVVVELGTDLDPWCYVLKPGCTVDTDDLRLLVSQWLNSGCEYPDWCGSGGADLDVSGKVDLKDFALLAQVWLHGV